MTTETKKKIAAQSHRAAMREIERKKAEVELEAARVDLESNRYQLRSRKAEHAKKANEDRAKGVFSLEASVGSNVVTLASDLRAWSRVNTDKPITLNIFSGGGSIMHGLVLYDTLRTLSDQGHHITTHIRGYGASMAGLIFLAGDTRLIGAESLVMIHSLSAGSGGSLHDMEDDLAFFKRLQSRLDGIILARTKISKKKLVERTKKSDWWLTSEEAVDLEVAHEIL